jgi:pyridoxine kinase
MPLALILSSYVAASRVGGMPQAFSLAPLKIDPVLVPTVVLGRRPGAGTPPGGGALSPDFFSSLCEGVAANGVLGLADVLICGYFASAEQVRVAAALIDRARVAERTGAYGPRLHVVVDPIMGDEPEGLYVPEAVAEAIATELLPRADIVTPNLWELRRLTGRPATTLEEIVASARALPCPALVTSVPAGQGEIGGVFVGPGGPLLIAHRRHKHIPHGTGDVVTAFLAAGLIQGDPPADAAVYALQCVAELAQASVDWNAPELPIVAAAPRIARPSATIRLQPLPSA